MAFDKQEYDRCDQTSKEIVAEHLQKEGMFTNVREDYNADIKAVAFINGRWRREYHEAEIKEIWKRKNFPFDTLHIPYRKRRLFTKHGTKGLYFWVLCSNLRWAYKIPATILKKCDVVKKYCRNSKRKEDFFEIPIVLAPLVQLKTKLYKKK